MTDQTTTTGTRPPDDADALESTGTSGTPDGEQSRDAESGEDKTDWKAIALANKQRIAEMDAKLKELEGDSQQPPVAESPEVQEKTSKIDDLLERAEAFRRQGDPVAAVALETRAELLGMQRDLILQRQLDAIPKDEQKAVLKHFNKNRHRLGDIDAARSELRTPTLEREVEELRQKLAKLEKGPDPDVVNAPPTHGREITARETKVKTINRSAWEAEQARLEWTNPDEFRRRQREVRTGKVRLDG